MLFDGLRELNELNVLNFQELLKIVRELDHHAQGGRTMTRIMDSMVEEKGLYYWQLRKWRQKHASGEAVMFWRQSMNGTRKSISPSRVMAGVNRCNPIGIGGGTMGAYAKLANTLAGDAPARFPPCAGGLRIPLRHLPKRVAKRHRHGGYGYLIGRPAQP